jgi:transcriptional regulator with XRE-family HTH domain
MQSIGERLEEARKRKGISLREAAEATKIRSDFLGFIEQNKMDFDLPEIYKRGFLKNYARYLKLDVDKIMTDYNAQQLSNSRLGKKGGTEWFGQMEVKKSEENEAAGQGESEHSEHSQHSEHSERSGESARFGRIAPKKPAHNHGARNHEAEGSEADEADKTFYMKIGLIFVGTLALVFVVFGLIWAILGSGDSEGTEGTDGGPDLREPAGMAEAAEPTPPSESDNQITLYANNADVYVTVTQRNDGKRIYNGSVTVGEPLTLEKEGPVEIMFTRGENLLIETKGERFRPSESGIAKTVIP